MKEIVKYLGNFGVYQAFLYALILLPGFLGGSTTLMFSWTGHSPDTRCCVPELDGPNCTGPYRIDPVTTGVNSSHLFMTGNKCSRCDLDNDGECTFAKATDCRGHGVVRDPQTVEIPNSVSILWQLDCDRVWMKRLVWSLNTLGFLIGAAIFSMLSDMFGRRRVFLCCSLAYAIVCHVAVFSVNYYMFCAMQVLIGALNMGVYLTAFVVFMELVDGMPRTLCGIFYQGYYTLGMLYDGLCAYYVRDWHMLQWLAGAPTLLLVVNYWLFPESIRWLIVNNRPEEARKYVERAARVNKVHIPEHVLQSELHAPPTEHDENHRATVLDLFSHWRLGKNTSIVWFSWFATSMGFYGLSQNTSDLPGSPYWTFTLSALIEFPAYVLAVPLTQYWGRKPALVLLFGVGGLSCIGAGVLRGYIDDWMIVALAMTGKGAIAASFAVIYNYAAEVFPTALRQTGTGFSSVWARVGSFLAPQIRLLGDYGDPRIPIIIYGLVNLAAAFLDLFLPETKGEQLPETVEDGYYFGVKKPWQNVDSGDASNKGDGDKGADADENGAPLLLLDREKTAA